TTTVSETTTSVTTTVSETTTSATTTTASTTAPSVVSVTSFSSNCNQDITKTITYLEKDRGTLSIDHLHKITKCTLENEAKGEFITRFDQFNAQIKRVEQKIEDADKRVNKKVDQLPQKIDNNYETNAT
ncbi:unnamed protein product, partial [Rotaria sordida]